MLAGLGAVVRDPCVGRTSFVSDGGCAMVVGGRGGGGAINGLDGWVEVGSGIRDGEEGIGGEEGAW